MWKTFFFSLIYAKFNPIRMTYGSCILLPFRFHVSIGPVHMCLCVCGVTRWLKVVAFATDGERAMKCTRQHCRHIWEYSHAHARCRQADRQTGGPNQLKMIILASKEMKKRFRARTRSVAQREWGTRQPQNAVNRNRIHSLTHSNVHTNTTWNKNETTKQKTRLHFFWSWSTFQAV